METQSEGFGELAKGGRLVTGEAFVTVTLSTHGCRLNVDARRAMRNPEYLRILATPAGAVRLMVSDGSGANDIRVHVDGTFGRLHLFAQKYGFQSRAYSARLQDGALEFRLERAIQGD